MTLRRQLPCVMIATSAVVLIPLLSVSAAEALLGLESALLSVAVVVALSFAVASAGSAYWARQPGSRDLVFGDLMIWGWIRRLRTERRLAQVRELLGLGRSGMSVLESDLSPDEQRDLLERLAASLEARDPHTHGHSRRVTRYAEMIAQGMGLSEEDVAKVRTAAALHDVGKIETPREVLNKPGKLTDEEFDVIKRHPIAGSEMVAGLGNPEMTAIVRHHHERLDGRGYPDRLAGEEIPLGARIIAVADTFDAITSSRAYRPALLHRKALEILKGEAGTQLDPDAVAAFLVYYSGSRSASRWTFLITAPERIATSLRQGLQATTAGPIAKNTIAVAATALLGSSLGAPIASAVQGGKAEQSAPAAEIAQANVGGGQSGASPARAGTALRAHGARVAGEHAKSSPHAVDGDGSEQGATPESGSQPDSGPGTSNGRGNGHGKGSDSAPGRPSSPGRSGSAPGRADKPTPPRHGSTPPGQVDKPTAPGHGGSPPGQENKPASPGGGPSADSPSNGGGNGDGNGGANDGKKN